MDEVAHIVQENSRIAGRSYESAVAVPPIDPRVESEWTQTLISMDEAILATAKEIPRVTKHVSDMEGKKLVARMGGLVLDEEMWKSRRATADLLVKDLPEVSANPSQSMAHVIQSMVEGRQALAELCTQVPEHIGKLDRYETYLKDELGGDGFHNHVKRLQKQFKKDGSVTKDIPTMPVGGSFEEKLMRGLEFGYERAVKFQC
jgi:hypothetical protein